MANIRPFKALRPRPEYAKQVSSVPYDVIYESEVRSFLRANPLSFLSVTRAEAEFAEDAGTPPDEVFAQASRNLDRLIKDDVYSRDSHRAYYVYKISYPGHTQTGLVGVCSLDEYEQDIIKKHENVRPDKVEDRTAHLLAVEAQTGLILLTFRGTDDIRELFEEALEGAPTYDFKCEDGIRQRIWRVEETASWTEAFREVPALYVADGHHRLESARVARRRLREANPAHGGGENYNYVLAGMFPAEDLRILPYNRIVKDLNGLSLDDFFAAIRENFILVSDTIEKGPRQSGEFCMYIASAWYKLRFNPKLGTDLNALDGLDTTILQDYLLRPVLGLDDPRTDERLGFVGGKRGTGELERLVDEGEARVAFSLHPTTMDDLLAVSDMGEIMPPKSTWFEPKLKDGLLVYQI